MADMTPEDKRNAGIIVGITEAALGIIIALWPKDPLPDTTVKYANRAYQYDIDLNNRVFELGRIAALVKTERPTAQNISVAVYSPSPDEAYPNQISKNGKATARWVEVV